MGVMVGLLVVWRILQVFGSFGGRGESLRPVVRWDLPVLQVAVKGRVPALGSGGRGAEKQEMRFVAETEG